MNDILNSASRSAEICGERQAKTAGQEERSDDSMSLVGILQCKDGLLAFGDSKSTITKSNGQLTEQLGRTVKKTFCGNSFILVTYGANESPDSEHSFLEEWIDGHIEQAASYDDLFERLSRAMATKENTAYCFIVGSSDASGFFRRDVTVRKSQTIYGIKQYDRCLIMRNGDERYFDWLDDTVMPVLLSMTADEMQAYLKPRLERAIIGNDENGYNTVGLPVTFVTLKKSQQ